MLYYIICYAIVYYVMLRYVASCYGMLADLCLFYYVI